SIRARLDDRDGARQDHVDVTIAAEHRAQGSSVQSAPPPARRATGLASRAADLSQDAMPGPPNPALAATMASGPGAPAADRPQQAQRQRADGRPTLGAGALALEAPREALGLRHG